MRPRRWHLGSQLVPLPGPIVKRVAVFGNTGGGKSTLARRLTELTDPQHAQQLPRDLAMSPPLDAEVQTARRGARQHKRVHHLRSADAMDAFLDAVRLEAQRA